MKKVAIIGSGDLGQLIGHHAKHSYKVAGFFDDYQEVGTKVDALPVLGKIDDIEEQFATGVFDEIMIAVGYKHFAFREALFERFKEKIPFATIIHPSCSVDPSCLIGAGSCLLPGSVLDRNVVIANNVLINVGCTIAHDTTVQSHSFLSPRVALAGFINIGERCNIGINTTVIDKISITSDVQTGGGTVIIKNIEKPGLYVGNPAKFIR